MVGWGLADYAGALAPSVTGGGHKTRSVIMRRLSRVEIEGTR